MKRRIGGFDGGQVRWGRGERQKEEEGNWEMGK
jgi:hypothetical protein